MSTAITEKKSCLNCILYNSKTNYCVLYGTFLSSHEACEWHMTEWGSVNWLRSFLERFAYANLKRSMPRSGGGR